MIKNLQIKEPTLLLDREKVLRNIKRMSEKAKKSGVIFRPHFKTHQSKKIGSWFRDFLIDKITVSSLNMALYFSEDNWQDITVAFPVNLREIEKINYLSSKITLNLLVESVESVRFLKSELKNPVNIFIKIDTGYKRTGVFPQNIDIIDKILEETQKSDLLEFKRFLTHAGHTYKAKSVKEIKEIYKETVRILRELKSRYIKDFPDLILSIGDTPSCSVVENFEGVDEVRPGNFVFYDVQQLELGVCNSDDIAVCMACPVVAKHKDRKEVVIYGGAVHFSKDYAVDKKGNIKYGYLAEFDGEKWDMKDKCCYLKSLSQEHGILKTCDYHFERLKIGDIVFILPAHSCLTANLMKSYMTLEGILIKD